jgi:hypothetical protein
MEVLFSRFLLLTEVLSNTGNLTEAESDLPEFRKSAGVPYDAIAADQCSHLIVAVAVTTVFVHAVGLRPVEHRG